MEVCGLEECDFFECKIEEYENKEAYKNDKNEYIGRGYLIHSVEDDKNKYIFHAGTKIVNSKYYSTGGRVLNFVSVDENFVLARQKSLELIKKLNWKNGHYRNDIGHKVINKK